MGPMRLLKTDYDAEMEGKEEGEDKGNNKGVCTSLANTALTKFALLLLSLVRGSGVTTFEVSSIEDDARGQNDNQQ